MKLKTSQANTCKGNFKWKCTIRLASPVHYHVALPSRNVIRNLTADSCKAASDGFVGEVWSLQIAFEGVTTKYLKLHSVELSTRLGSQLTFFFWFWAAPHPPSWRPWTATLSNSQRRHSRRWGTKPRRIRVRRVWFPFEKMELRLQKLNFCQRIQRAKPDGEDQGDRQQKRARGAPQSSDGLRGGFWTKYVIAALRSG